MKRKALLLSLILLCSIHSWPQSISDSIDTEEIDTILRLIDAVALAESKIVDGEPIGPDDVETLVRLVRIGDAIGAEDVAARARTLITIARPAPQPPPDQQSVETPFPGAPSSNVARDDRAFQTWTTVLTAGGGAALVLSGVMYAIAERDYRAWQESEDEATRGELFQAWRGYELLSLGMGGLATLSLGVGLPLTFGLADPKEAAATPPSREVFTAEERLNHLNELYAARASLVTEIDTLSELEPRRRLVKTIGVTAGVTGVIAAASFFYLAEERYASYVEAPFSSDAERLRRQVRLLDALAVFTGVASMGGFTTAAAIEFATDDREELQRRLTIVNERIIELRTSQLMIIETRTDLGPMSR
jgi:hypothetical protein